jgi:TctA family transporter
MTTFFTSPLSSVIMGITAVILLWGVFGHWSRRRRLALAGEA